MNDTNEKLKKYLWDEMNCLIQSKILIVDTFLKLKKSSYCVISIKNLIFCKVILMQCIVLVVNWSKSINY